MRHEHLATDNYTEGTITALQSGCLESMTKSCHHLHKTAYLPLCSLPPAKKKEKEGYFVGSFPCMKENKNKVAAGWSQRGKSTPGGGFACTDVVEIVASQ